MIEREQIAQALRRLDPRDREILDYSLRRRVPDDDLAALFASEPSEVARRRAAAIEALSTDLGAQRGADLGHILKELLEGDTWALIEGAPAAAAAPPAAPEPAPPEPEPKPEPETEPTPDPDPDPAAAGDHPPLGASASPPASPSPAPREDDAKPVLGMLSDPQPPSATQPAAAAPPERSRSRRRLVVGLAAAAAVVVPAGMVAALATGGDPDRESGGSGQATREFAPQREGSSAEPFPADPQSAEQYPIARVNKRTTLYREPGGKARLRIAAKTEWDSPRILSVVERRGRWLAVLVPELKNGQQAWVRDSQVSNISSVTWAVRADLSRRTLEVRHNGKTVRTMKIGVGRTDHPTPVGRYAVTDKLRVSDPGSPYGCCVLALTGHQTKLPEGWPGGDRLAVHATRDLSGLGKRVSLGCMRTDPRDTKWMMKRLPLGTPVFVDA